MTLEAAIASSPTAAQTWTTSPGRSAGSPRSLLLSGSTTGAATRSTRRRSFCASAERVASSPERLLRSNAPATRRAVESFALDGLIEAGDARSRMAIADRRTVWILGAGFSRSLGAPLLAGLFRQQHFRDLQEALPGNVSLAANVAWTQALFNQGKDVDHLWDDGEEFLSFVDAATGNEAGVLWDVAKNAELMGLVARGHYLNRSEIRSRLTGLTDDSRLPNCIQDPANTVRRALAFEASRFLRNVRGEDDERWKPYRDWAKSLSPEHDSIVTFNYDTLLETLGKPFHVVMPPSMAGPDGVVPDRTVPNGTVPVFKLHGSADWETDESFSLRCVRNKNAVDQNVPLAIAAPGRSKASISGSLFKPIWDEAKVKLREAAEVVVIGYSFPKTDALARMTLLDSIAGDSSNARVRRATLVLGPDVNSDVNARVLELLRHRMGPKREVFVNQPATKSISYGGEGAAVVNQHRLWAEDFIADYELRTAPKWI